MEQHEAGPRQTEDATFVLERGKRLSDSLVWGLQRSFYSRRGEQAWLTDRIPYYITSNPFIARAYVQVVLGWHQDCAAAEAPAGPLDRSAPLYTLELAAGSGRFAFLFLKKLQQLLREPPAFDGPPVCYVMSDLAPANVAAWRANERLKPFVEAGLLDFAVFDLERDRELELLHSGRTLSAATLRNPLAVVANYTFDTTAQDVFWVKEGVLQEGLVTVASSRREESLADPEVLQRVSTRYELRPARRDYYEDEAMNRVLAGYAGRLGDTSFVFPVGALKGINNLISLSGGRLLLLSGDKGYSHEDELVGRGDPQLTLHAGQCFSMMVNYHAIGLYFRERGGFARHTATRDKRLKVSAFQLGGSEPEFLRTGSAFRQALAGFGPCEYYALVAAVRKELKAPSLDLMLALLKLADWDPHLLHDFAASLAEQVKKAPPGLRQELVQGLQKGAELFYPMDQDLPFELGRLYAALDRPADALRCYLESLRLYKDHPATLFNAGLCFYRLQRPREALELMEKALQLKEGYAPAREWRLRIQGELSGG